jgi:hypothetical protein
LLGDFEEHFVGSERMTEPDVIVVGLSGHQKKVYAVNIHVETSRRIQV